MPIPADFPKHIDIGGIQYDVVAHNTKVDDSDYGEFDPFEYEIKVDADRDRTTQTIGLFHEWFHGIMQHNGMAAALPDEEQERLCNIVSYWIAGMFEQGVIRFNTGKKQTPEAKQ